MDKKIKINPLNVFGMRRAKFCPPHFESVNVDLTYNMSRALQSWIDEHTTGRYFIGSKLDPSFKGFGGGKVKYSTNIAFENSKDLSYFLLACPYLKY
jgi:hypothetical protein